MTRKTRSRQFHAFPSGYCAVCHIGYNSLADHFQSKRHLKIIGEDDGNFIAIKGLDSLLALDGIDALEVNDYSSYKRNKMPRTRTSSIMYVKESQLSPIESDSGHRLRSRKNINYLTPPLEDDSLTEKPEIVREYRELRSSTRLLAKLTDQMVEVDEVWNSGRPKRACNRSRISVDESVVNDTKSKVEVLSTKLRSSIAPAELSNQSIIYSDDDNSTPACKKLRNSELIRLNNEAESFLFPKKGDMNSSDEEEAQAEPEAKKIKIEHDIESSPESKKKKRRTHAELFISENEKYYKFETPGSRLRKQATQMPKSKNNGSAVLKSEEKSRINLDDYNFSFENVPKTENWFRTFHRKDMAEENYVYLDDTNYWDAMILPYQLSCVPPLDPTECVAHYNQIKKCLTEPPSTTTSVTCSTPDPTASHSSIEPFDDDNSKTSAIDNISNSSNTMDELVRPMRNKKRKFHLDGKGNGNGKNPRKSPRKHASTLAILSSLIQQRKKKALRRSEAKNLSTIVEESPQGNGNDKIEYFVIAKNFEEEFARICDENHADEEEETLIFGPEASNEISFKRDLSVNELLEAYEGCRNFMEISLSPKRALHARPGRKPGKRKKNRTGWPMNKNRRFFSSKQNSSRSKESNELGDSLAAAPEESEPDGEIVDETTDNCRLNHSKESDIAVIDKLISENNNKNDQSSDVVITDNEFDSNNCDLDDRVESSAENGGVDKVLTTKVNNGSDLQYQECDDGPKNGQQNSICEQTEANTKTRTSPKRTNRVQRRMPASPRSPRMLRKPRGRWYRER